MLLSSLIRSRLIVVVISAVAFLAAFSPFSAPENAAAAETASVDICSMAVGLDFEFPIFRPEIAASLENELAGAAEEGAMSDLQKLYFLAACNYLSGEPAKAAEYFDRCSREDGSYLAKASLGLSLLDKCEYGSAAVRLREAVSLKPDFEPAAALYAEALFRSGSVEAALSFAGDRLASTESVALRVALGRIHDELGDYPKALEQFDKAGKAAPKSKVPPFYSALMYLALGDSLSAAGEAEKLEKIDAETGRFMDQLVSFAALGTTNAELAATYRAMGQNCFAQGDYVVACIPYSAALRFDPKDFESRKGLAASLFRINDFRRAFPNMEAAAAAKPESSAAVYDFALLACRIGDATRAVGLLKRSAAIDPGNSGAPYNLGVIYDDAGEYEKAAAAFRAAIAIDPGYALAHFNLGVTYGRYMGDYEKAVEPLSRAAKIKPDWDEAWYNLACALTATGKLEKALESYKKAMTLGFSDVDALNLNMGICLAKMKNYPDAITAFERCLLSSPENGEARFNLGAALVCMGDRKAATREYEELKKLDSPFAEKLLQLIEKK